MVKKIVYILIFLLMLLGVGIYFRIEFKYMMIQNGQNTLILNKLKKVEALPANTVSSQETQIAYVADENGVGFAADLQLYIKYLQKSCQNQCLNRLEYYKALDTILNQLHLNALWVTDQTKSGDKVAGYILKREINLLNETLLGLRKTMSSEYQKITTNEVKYSALETIRKIDSKLKELKEK